MTYSVSNDKPEIGENPVDKAKFWMYNSSLVVYSAYSVYKAYSSYSVYTVYKGVLYSVYMLERIVYTVYKGLVHRGHSEVIVMVRTVATEALQRGGNGVKARSPYGFTASYCENGRIYSIKFWQGRGDERHSSNTFHPSTLSLHAPPLPSVYARITRCATLLLVVLITKRSCQYTVYTVTVILHPLYVVCVVVPSSSVIILYICTAGPTLILGSPVAYSGATRCI